MGSDELAKMTGEELISEHIQSWIRFDEGEADGWGDKRREDYNAVNAELRRRLALVPILAAEVRAWREADDNIHISWRSNEASRGAFYRIVDARKATDSACNIAEVVKGNT